MSLATSPYAAAEELERYLGDPADPRSPLSFERIVELDEQEVYPEAVCQLLYRWGFHRYYVPAELGGKLTSFEEILSLVRVISRRDLSVAISDAHTFLGSIPVWIGGDEGQQRALAEELDMPVGIHIGTGPPGAIYLGASGYRARLHSALTLEEVLVRHPRLRVYVMHAGFPLLDDMLALMYAHPQVYVGVGVIVFTQPRASFYRYLQGIVDAGFGNRVMFGSDHMVWPDAIDRSIAVIDEAPFLSDGQKRDILYHNAARFLRLGEEEIARHHGR